jgi:hypothetical protein
MGNDELAQSAITQSSERPPPEALDGGFLAFVASATAAMLDLKFSGSTVKHVQR